MNKINQIIAKYSIVYWIIIVACGVLAFATASDGPRYGFLVAAVVMAAYYIVAKIQG